MKRDYDVKRSRGRPYHLTRQDIASFAGGNAERLESLRIRAHLEGCDDCMDAYRVAVRHRDAGGSLPMDVAPSPTERRAVAATARRDYARRNRGRRGRRRLTPVNPLVRKLLWVALVALAVAVVVFLVSTR
jgi:anti-sigma factor RsiW